MGTAHGVKSGMAFAISPAAHYYLASSAELCFFFGIRDVSAAVWVQLALRLAETLSETGHTAREAQTHANRAPADVWRNPRSCAFFSKCTSHQDIVNISGHSENCICPDRHECGHLRL